MPLESQQDHGKKKIGRPRKYDEEFRRAALEKMKSSQDVGALARELGLNRSQIYRLSHLRAGRSQPA